MRLPEINLEILDESATFRYRWSLFEKFINEGDVNLSITIDEDESKLETEVVSILNLPSLKRGKTQVIIRLHIYIN